MPDLHALENLDSVLPTNPDAPKVLLWNKTKNVFVKNSKELNEAETQTLIASAQALIHNDFFLSLLEEMTSEGFRQMAKAKDWDGVTFGKACLFLADIAGKKARNAAKLPTKHPRPETHSAIEDDD